VFSWLTTKALPIKAPLLIRMDHTMIPRVEQNTARSLRAALAGLENGVSIEGSDDFRELLSGLEVFLPAILREVHQEWHDESLDGFHVAVAQKTGPCEAELIGLCILISDQTLTPIHVRLRGAATKDEIEWLECKVGETGLGKAGMVRMPYDSPKQAKMLFTLADRLGSIHWAYCVGFGSEGLAAK
jgi:hypothetical protein